jgi:hypothetical protein
MSDEKSYAPDVGKVLREMDPAKVLERRRDALAKFYTDDPAGEPAAPPGEAAYEVPPNAPATSGRARTSWRSWTVVAVCVLVAAAAPLVVVLSGRLKNPDARAQAPSATVVTATADAAPAAPAAPAPPAVESAAPPAPPPKPPPPKPPPPKHDPQLPGDLWH